MVLFCEYREFIDAIEVSEELLGFLVRDLLSSSRCDAVIVLRLFVSSYLSIFVLEDLLLLVVVSGCSMCRAFLIFYCALIRPNLSSG